jgi:16S rRNA processing protein RimM
VPDKKTAAKAAKPAAKSASAAKKAAAAPAAKKASPAKAVKTAKAKPAPKPAKAAAEPKPVAKAKASAKKAAGTKPAAKPKAAPKAKAAPKVAKSAAEAKPAAKAKAAAKPVKPAPAAKAAKPEKPAKAAKKAKAVKPPKPPKLAPVAAAFAGPIPSKPLAVAAGRAQPISRNTLSAPVRSVPKPLAAPKPVAATEPETVGDSQSVPAFKSKANGASKTGMVMVGAIAGAFGVKGEVRLRAFTEEKAGVISYGPLYGEDGKILLKPKSWRSLKDGVAVVTAEIKSKEEADKLKGVKLFVPRANLPTPEEDEFYIVDLLGCKAESLDGQVLGEICAVWNFGAGDIIEYRPPNGAPNVRITFTRETAPLVDLAGKRVVLDPPPPEPPPSK